MELMEEKRRRGRPEGAKNKVVRDKPKTVNTGFRIREDVLEELRIRAKNEKVTQGDYIAKLMGMG